MNAIIINGRLKINQTQLIFFFFVDWSIIEIVFVHSVRFVSLRAMDLHETRDKEIVGRFEKFLSIELGRTNEITQYDFPG